MALPDPSEERQQAISDNYIRTRNIIIGALAVSMLLQVYVWWVMQQGEVPGDSLMEFREARVLGDNNLCPGDVLTYQIVLRVQEAGVFDVDISVWRIDPPAVMIFSTTQRRVVFPGATTYTLARQWTVPRTVDDPVTNEPVRWLPGAYERRHAISTSSRSTEPSIISIPFNIRNDCP